jgi:hypothetical protein
MEVDRPTFEEEETIKNNSLTFHRYISIIYLGTLLVPSILNMDVSK